jgi:hypothetical protein
MDLYVGEIIGAGLVLIIALIVAVRILTEEIKEDIRIYRKRNNWRNRYK